MLYLIHQTIDQSAARSPTKEAFRFRGQALTYAALSQRTNQLANALINNGVQKGDRVGIYLQKSLECAIAIHGIMKAGAAYVPLDPIAPQDRIATIIQNCGISHIVTHDAKRRSVQKLVDADLGLSCIIGLSDDSELNTTVLSWDQVAAQAVSQPAVQIMEQDLAYIIYTSGSTGVPKGIMHTHASGLAYARMAAHIYGVTADDRLSNFPPLHFDQSTFDYFSGPLVGATTVIIPEEHTKLPASLAQLIEEEKLTIWYSVPFAMIQLLLRGALDQRDLSSLRWMIYGGEPFPVKHLMGLQAALPQVKFSNNYGPAETNQCTEYTLPKLNEISDEVRNEAIPIGNICPNMSYLIVDEDDQPIDDQSVALDQPDKPSDAGELLVQSPTMMQGYWNQPERNARCFYSRRTEGGLVEHYYRTGDLVQLDNNGLLWFLGRKDRQVKSRGYRIELDEIEAALLTHPAIEESAVFPVPDAEGNTLIRAAVIAKINVEENAPPTQPQLFKHLSQKLPAYAVPISIDIMEQFPRTTSNKIDRRALQEEATDGPYKKKQQ